MSKWPLYLLGGASAGLGTVLLTKWFMERDAWQGGVLEPEGSRDEEIAMTTTSMLSWPVRGSVRSPYGTRVNPITGQPGQFHNGIDIGIPAGTVIRAPADGTIQKVWEDLTYGGGYSMLMLHDAPLAMYATGYAHLSQWLVTAGQKVKRGDPIALSGGVKGQPGAGSSTGAHLHLTVRKNGITVDPIGELEPVPGVSPSIV